MRLLTAMFSDERLVVEECFSASFFHTLPALFISLLFISQPAQHEN